MRAGAQKHQTHARRTQILKAALRVIATSGTRGATTKAIAREVGLTEGALYHYFLTRDEILSQALAEAGATLQGVVRSARTRTADPLTQLEDVFLRSVHVLDTQPGISRLACSDEVRLLRPDLRRQVWTRLAGYLAQLRELVEAGQRAGRIRDEADAEALVVLMMGVIHTLTLHAGLSGVGAPLLPRAAELWRQIHALLAAPGEREHPDGTGEDL